MRRVTGIGGIFFKSAVPEALYGWYAKHLGIACDPSHGAAFPWREHDDPRREGMTLWSLFRKDSDYFSPSDAPFMINYRVENLDALLVELEKEGVSIDPRRENSDYGRFAWIQDPEGNRIELWQPPPSAPTPAPTPAPTSTPTST